MNTAKHIFLAITIILFALAIWPIALITAVVTLTLSVIEDIQRKKAIDTLQEEVNSLKKKIKEAEK